MFPRGNMAAFGVMHHGGVRRLLAAALAAAVTLTAAGLLAAPASASAGSAGQATGSASYLFTVQAARGTTTPLKVLGSEDERFRLTLTGVDPVTKFADRPFRNASLITPRALDANWNAWFAGDPPNAVLTYTRPGRAPASMVIALTRPTYDAKARTLTFTATREARTHDPAEKGANWQRITTPTSMTDVSLFIDDATTTASTDTTGPTVTSTGWNCPNGTSGGTQQCTLSFTVSDPSGVASVGSVFSVYATSCRPQYQTSLQPGPAGSVTGNATATLTCGSVAGTVSTALSSATDTAGNTTTNASLGIIPLGIV